MFKLQNPFPAQLRDTRSLQNLYKEYNLVPYAGTSSYSAHKLLKVLSEMPQLSGTHGSCINDIAKWCFRGKVGFQSSPIAGLDIESEDLGDGEKVRLATELLKYGVSPTLIQQLTEKLFKSWQKTGDLWLRYKEVTVGGTKRVFLSVVDPLNVMYLNTEPDGVLSAVISTDFFTGESSWKAKPPELLRVFPYFRGTLGNRETLLHVKNEDEQSLWYGRPHSFQALYWMATEWFQALHTLKVTKTETVAKAIMAMMNPDPLSMGQNEDPLKVVRDSRVEINRLTTNKGGDEVIDSIGVIGYPYNGKEPSLLKLDINRDTGWLKQSVATASDYIVAAHGWSKVLMGFDRPSSGIGGNVLIDEFTTKNEGTVKPFQRFFEYSIWGKVFGLMAEFTGVQDFSKTLPKFEDRVRGLVESLNENKNGAIQNIDTANGSDGSDGGTVPTAV